MKKFIATILTAAMAVSALTGCSAPAPKETSAAAPAPAAEAPVAPVAEAPAPKEATADQLEGTLNIWSFTNEVQVFSLAFREKYPKVNVQYTMIPMTDGEYQTKIKSAIQAGDVPDVIVLEATFVKEYVESDMLMDLNELLPLAKENETYQGVLDVGTSNGVVKAYSYQSTPGAVFYRRSLAKEYFGTDEPAKIQELLSDMSKFEAAAKVVKEKSNGNTYMVSSTGDFTNPVFNVRSKPWVVDEKLVIDDKVLELMDTCKNFRQNGYEAQATQWQEGWFAGMKDTLTDASGAPKKVFSYFLPTWGLPYVLMQNGPETAGDWACIDGPVPYSWGGTWLGAMKDAKNADMAKEFVRFSALNQDTLKNWALGKYTNEYLKKIDPSIGDTLAQGPGDFVSSRKVVNEIIGEFDNSETTKYLAGQNSYRGFAAAAEKVNLTLMQGTDDAIQRALADPLNAYASGKATKEEALNQFKDAVRAAVPDIIVE